MKSAAQLRLFAGITALALIGAGTVQADQNTSCVGTKWSVERDATQIRSADRASLKSGSAAVLGQAFSIDLVDLGSAKLPEPPGKPPKQEPSKAAFVRIAAPAKAGTIQVSASDPVWIDVVQQGHTLRSSAFSGSHDCKEVHKSVRFSVEALPFVLQISGTQAPRTSLVVLPIDP